MQCGRGSISLVPVSASRARRVGTPVISGRNRSSSGASPVCCYAVSMMSPSFVDAASSPSSRAVFQYTCFLIRSNHPPGIVVAGVTSFHRPHTPHAQGLTSLPALPCRKRRRQPAPPPRSCHAKPGSPCFRSERHPPHPPRLQQHPQHLPHQPLPEQPLP